MGGEVREYLVRAQEAEALADAADSFLQHYAWEAVASHYRLQARIVGLQLRHSVQAEAAQTN